MIKPVKRRTGDGVQIYEKIVTRTVIADRDLEIEKLNHLADCAEANGFVSPRAWPADDPVLIEMDRIQINDSSQNVFRKAVCEGNAKSVETCAAMVVEAGRVLALVHRHFKSCQESMADAEASGSIQDCWLHADYGFSNLHLTSDGNLVVLDPFPQFQTTFDIWHYGSRVLDLGMFASCLIGRLGAKDLISIKTQQLPQLLHGFVDSYNAHSECQVTMDSVIEQSIVTINAYFKQSKLTKRILGNFVWNRNLNKIRRLL